MPDLSPRQTRRGARGEYRPIYRALLDDVGYQKLPPDARLTLLTLKASLGAAGIGVMYGNELQARTGLRAARMAKALDAVIAAGWLQRDHHVVWVVTGLQEEPSLSANDPKHRAAIQRTIAALPHLPIVDAFAAHYAEWFTLTDDGQPAITPSATHHTEGPTQGPLKGLQRPLQGPCVGPSKGHSGSGSGSGSTKPPRSARHEPDGFAEAWAAYPSREGGNSRAAAARAYAARLGEGVTAADLLAGVQRYRAFCDAKGWTGGPYIKLASTFFGPDAHYAEPWAVASPATDTDKHVMGPDEFAAYLAAEDADVLQRQAARDAERAAAEAGVAS